jgi:DMSO/TMAO reductase YedYZ molybdopterin-dependent catalytic subunit
VLETNEEIARDYFKPSRLAAQFSRDQARMPRANGLIGLEQPAELGNWKVRVEGMETGAAEVTLEEIRSLPPAEMTTEIKCIEGWSEIVHWRGTRFSDFARRFSPPEETPDSYVGMETPDGLYYVGLDWASAIHPQTLLCWEMNGQPLEQKHGAPLRLVIPVKYGIKNIKRIGRVVYQSRRPADYWAESGYDWFAGL